MASSRRRAIVSVSRYVVLSVVGFLMVLPLIWMLATSLMTLTEATTFPPRWIPRVPQWGNYQEALESGMARAFFNTVYVCVFITLGQLFTASCGAYAFSRLRFRGRDQLFLLYIATMMIPRFVTLIPTYMLIKWFGWINTYMGLIFPGLFTPFGTFLLRQAFMTVPVEYEESMILDGASHYRIFYSLVLPLSKAGLAVLAVFAFAMPWNNLLWPLIVISKRELFTTPLAIAMFRGEWLTYVNTEMAAAAIAIVPVVIFFTRAQQRMVNSMAFSGVKA